MNVINAGVGYRFDNGWRIQLDALNLLNSTTDLATYAYGSLLTSDAMYAMCYPTPKMPAAVCQNGVMDYIYHPIEPLAFRLTLAGPLETIDTINIPAMAAEMRRSFPAAPMPAGRLRLDRASMSARMSTTAWSKPAAAPSTRRPAPRPAPIFGNTAGLARRRSSRLRLHDAVPRRAWH